MDRQRTPRFGLLGEKLGHSYSPAIYHKLAGLDYVSFQKRPEDVERFICEDRTWDGLNVTIPYKRTVLPWMDELSEAARRVGNVNTVKRMPDGRLFGDNTDYLGFQTLVASLGVDIYGKVALVLGGRGGAGATCMAVLEDMGALPVAISRSSSPTYDELGDIADASIVVNATPAGMYPNCPAAPCTLEALPALEAVVDIVYNPARTGILLEAEHRGIPHANGLLMLVAQAAGSLKVFTGCETTRKQIDDIVEELSFEQQNIALIGMPGAGKTRVGQQLARLLGRQHVDIDLLLEERIGCSCASFITRYGEEAFREQETEALSDIAKRSGLVISCGGGIVTRDENLPLLHQNSLIIMLDRPLEELSSKGRPISARDGVEKLARERMHRYRSWADFIIRSRESAVATAEAILSAGPISHDTGASL